MQQWPRRQNPEPTKRRQRRKYKSELRKEAKPYVLDPATLYVIECGTVIRTFARWVLKRGYAPTLKDVCKSKVWNRRALERYVADLVAQSLLETVPGRGYMPTAAGWVVSRYAPALPKYSTNPRARNEQKRREREIEGAIECHQNALNAR